MRSNRAARGRSEIVDGLQVARSRRVSVHVENKHVAGIEACQPELAPVIGKSTVVRLVSPLDRRAADDFAVIRRPGLYIDGCKFICAISEAFNPECPHINELLLTIDARKIR